MNVLVDTNVFVAAFIRQQGFMLPLLRKAVVYNYRLWVSEVILTECRAKVLELGATNAEYDRFERDIRGFLRIAHDPKKYSAKEIAEDEHIIDLALRVGTDLVLTNDKRLIETLTVLDIAAVRPSQFKTYLPK